MKILLFPYLLQMLVMTIDEFYFHRKRGLPLWEAYGHPLDTLSVLLCYGFVSISSPSPLNTIIYSVLLSISCLLITKDEWVHQKLCSGMEQWLHSILFVLHPITLGLAGWGWVQGGIHSFYGEFTSWTPSLLNFIKFQMFMILLFMIYQFFYWRTRCTSTSQERPKSLTRSTTN
ncbi:MAG: hypothetical protein ABIQ95_12505 [Bdellovibrionia bacterium]